MNKDIHKTWGIVTLLFWSPMILFYLYYPLSSWRMIGWILYLAIFAVVVGITSGVLLLVSPLAGKILAVSLSVILLVVKFGQIIFAYPHIGERLYANYVVFMQVKPVQVIYNDIFGIIFFISTIYFFMKRTNRAD